MPGEWEYYNDPESAVSAVVPTGSLGCSTTTSCRWSLCECECVSRAIIHDPLLLLIYHDDGTLVVWSWRGCGGGGGGGSPGPPVALTFHISARLLAPRPAVASLMIARYSGVASPPRAFLRLLFAACGVLTSSRGEVCGGGLWWWFVVVVASGMAGG